ncbi:MAG: DNA adenine methylase [Planctomycetes bacterium]|nr:DNA adenine methylase [Planctomycetota bacterium]
MNESLRTLWYMGAKSRLVPDFIDGAVGDLVAPGGTVLDLCAGTGVVARSLATRYRVYANDAQRFSSVLAAAHLVGDAGWVAELDRLDPEEDLDAAFRENLDALTRWLPRALELEAALLPRVIEELGRPRKERATDAESETTTAASRYRAFVETLPLSVSEAGLVRATPHATDFEPLVSEYATLLDARRCDPSTRPYGLMTLYYQGVYFGLRQALVIDSLRAAIDAIPATDPFRERKHDLYLGALLQACSTSTSGTSHFAQPRALTRDSELLAVARRRSIDIETEFYRALDGIRREWGEHPRFSPMNRVFGSTAGELLSADGPLADGEVDLVYLDPPYTADNYSRFYHVLETIVSYDYPELEERAGQITKGRYPVRARRFQSDFCRADRVEGAFREVVSLCAERKIKLLVSYSPDSGLLLKSWRQRSVGDPMPPESRFLALFRDYYSDVEMRTRDLLHSGQGDSNRSVREVLVLCEDV